MTTRERFTVAGKQVTEAVKDLIKEGNVRHVRVLHGEKVLLNLPLSIGLPATMAVIIATPLLAALAASAVLLTDCTVEVERAQ